MNQGEASDSGSGPSGAAWVETFRLTLDGEHHTVPIASGEKLLHNLDGSVDVTSIYENGKLVRREVSDPALLPL